jgi:hypothetical protein
MKKIIILIIALFTAQIIQANCSDELIDTVKIGDYAFGGVVFWVDNSGRHGLVCAIADQARGIMWKDGMGDRPDSEKTNKNGGTVIENIASQVCKDYSVSVDGLQYDDWYFPSKDEVYRMFEKRSIIDNTAIKKGGSSFAQNNELSPTEFCNSPAWDQVFNYGYRDYDYKNSRFNVRAVSAF